MLKRPRGERRNWDVWQRDYAGVPGHRAAGVNVMHASSAPRVARERGP